MTCKDENQIKLVVSFSNSTRRKVLEQHYLDFWKIPYTYTLEKPEHPIATIIDGENIPPITELQEPAIIVPSNKPTFYEWVKKAGIKFAHQRNVKLVFQAKKDACVELPVNEFCSFQGNPTLVQILSFSGRTVLHKFLYKNAYLLSIDLVEEFKRFFDAQLEDSPCFSFELYARIPATYSLAPRDIRNRILRTRIPRNAAICLEDKCSLDALRHLFLIVLLEASKVAVPTLCFWPKNKKFACCLTHDVETAEGLERSFEFKRVEQKYAVRSCWNLPSERYPLQIELVTKLAEESEIGAHDTKHDGKLAILSDQQLEKRLRACKDQLSKIAKIYGFRAPLLQHSLKIIAAVANSGYTYDNSCPTWEPLSPTSMKAHGIGTAFPFEINNIVEIPVTLPQDQQLLSLLGMNPAQSIDLLSKLRKWLQAMSGLCTLLFHPDYVFTQPENLVHYDKCISEFANDHECWMAMPSELAMWWKQRGKARLWVRKLANGKLSFGLEGIPTESTSQFVMCVFDGYDQVKGLTSKIVDQS